MIELGDLAHLFAIAVTITITVAIASKSISNDDDTVVKICTALSILEDTARVQREIT